MVKVATIAGSDTSGGAGLEADLKVFSEFGLYGMAAVTVIATMNSKDWSHSVFPLDSKILEAQMDTVFSGVGTTTAKSGMLGTEENVKVLARALKENNVTNYVLDPVMVCKGTDEALNPEVNAATENLLLPMAMVVTPNIFETEQLSGIKINGRQDMQEAARILIKKGAKNVFVKGGVKLATMENSNESCDLFYDGTDFSWLAKPLISTKWNHGAGCTTSAAIAASLALGKSPFEAVQIAKNFIQKSLSAGFPLNEFVGPGNPSAWRKGNLFLDCHE